MRDFVEVDRLIHQGDQPAVANGGHKMGEQLEVVVPIAVADDDAHAEGCAGFGFGGEFAAQPAQGGIFAGFVVVEVALPVGGQHLGIVKAVDHAFHLVDGGVDLAFDGLVEGG